MKRLIDSAVLHVVPSSEAPNEHSIPVDRLMEIAQGLYDIISGLADEKRDDETDNRTKAFLTDSAKDHYRIYFRPPENGCFALPVDLYDTRDTPENNDQLFDGYEVNFDTVESVIRFANNNDRESFGNLVKSPAVASKVTKGISTLSPKNGETITLIGARRDGENPVNVEISPNASSNTKEWTELLEGPFETELLATICAIDFESKQLKVKPLNSNHKFPVPCNQEIESQILRDVRGKQWKLLCAVKHYANGALSSIEEVKGIEELQFRTHRIDEFTADGEKITFKEALDVKEELDPETNQAFIAQIPELGIFVFSEFQEDILELIHNELENKWCWLVQAPDNQLTPRAQEIKNAFLQMVERG